MMARAVWLLLVALALPVVAGAADLRDLDAVVEEGIREQRYPGAVLIVGRGGKTLWARAYGHHTYDPGSPPMRLETLFDLASVSKVAGTTPAALLMLEDGRMRLEDPVSAYVSGFGAHGKGAATVRDLLTHVSGLPAYDSHAVVEKLRRPEETHAQALMRRCASLKPTYLAGSRVLYSCLNMQTMAGAVQHVSGEPLQELLARRIWRPLGMRDTTYRPDLGQVARCAPTGMGADGAPVRGLVHDPLARYHGADGPCPGNAGLFSTAPDLARYARMLVGRGRAGTRRVLHADTVRLMASVHTPPTVPDRRGLGWSIYAPRAPYATGLNALPEAYVIGHTGYTGTWMWLDMRSGTYIVFLSNRVFPSPATSGGEGRTVDGIRQQIARIVLARTYPHTRRPSARQARTGGPR